MKPRPSPPARPHGAFSEPLPGIFVVMGTHVMGGLLPLRFGRAMTVVREDGRLVLFNSVRLDDAGLAALDALGRVTDVVRLAGNHGLDDPFYKERYGANVWAPEGAPYMPGFDPRAEPYFEPDVRFHRSTALPLRGARVHLFASIPTEALVVLPQHGGVVVAGDALQNWEEPDPYCNFAGALALRLFGLVRPAGVGLGWLRQCRPPAGDLAQVLELGFEHVSPAHGTPVIGEAKEKYRAALEAAVAARRR